MIEIEMDIHHLIKLHEKGKGMLQTFSYENQSDNLGSTDIELFNDYIAEVNHFLYETYPKFSGHTIPKMGQAYRIIRTIVGQIEGEYKARSTLSPDQIKNLKSEVESLKKGQGIFCKYIENDCNISVSQIEQGFVIFDYKKKEFGKVIEKVLEKYGINPIIAGHLSEKGSVGLFCVNICQKIRGSKICVADVTEDNTNVGLELGLAWRFNVPVFITFDTNVRENPPSDLSAFTQIRYKNSNELEKQLASKIQKIDKN